MLMSCAPRQPQLFEQPVAEAVRVALGLLVPSPQKQMPGATLASCYCQAHPAGCSCHGASSWSSASHQGASSMVQRGV